MAKDVTVVIVHYQTYEQTLCCLDSLRALDFPSFNVVVVDNNSPDGSGSRLRDEVGESENLEFILNDENKGFAAGCNIGIREAIDRQSKFIWLLNPDTVVRQDSLRTLVEGALKAPKVGAFGSKILFKASIGKVAPEIWSAGADVDERRGLVSMRGFGEIDKGQFDSAGPCGYLPGASLFVRREVFEDVGLIDEDYFLFFEETDWCARARRSGYELRLIPESVVYHDFEKSKQSDPLRVYYYNRNELFFWSRFGCRSLRLEQIFRTVFIVIPKTYLAYRRSMEASEKNLLGMQLRSYCDFLRGYRGMIGEVQK